MAHGRKEGGVLTCGSTPGRVSVEDAGPRGDLVEEGRAEVAEVPRRQGHVAGHAVGPQDLRGILTLRGEGDGL